MNKDSLRIGLFWHSHNSANLGVGALTVSNMILARQVAEEMGYNAEFVIAGPREHGPSYVEDKNAQLRVIDRKFVTSPAGLWKTVGDLDAVLDITGGDSFTDIYGPKRYAFQHITKSIAILRKVPLVFSPQTVGPFQPGLSARLARWAMSKADSVIARDHASFIRAGKLAPEAKISESIDVAFVLPFQRVELPQTDKKRIGLNVSGLLWSERKENDRFNLGYDYRALVRGILQHFTAMPDVEVHLIPHVHAPHLAYENDCVAHDALAKEFPGVITVPQFASPSAAKSYIAAMDFFMGSRMHACIAAYSSGTPLVPISYSPKFDGLFGTLNYPWLVPVTGAATEQAIEIIAKAFNEREAMRENIAENRPRVEALQENYREHLRNLFRRIVERKRAA